MRFVLKYKKEISVFLIISIIYFVLRLPNLTSQPIFADEAIYIRWAQVMRAEPTLRFLPLTDGKTPLFMWTLIPLFKVFDDPLLAGRLLSILSGFATLVGVTFLGWRYFGRKVGLWAAFFVAVTPFMVFFDRMALVDSMLATFTIWSLIAALLLMEYQRIDLAMVLGFLLGGGMLTKTPASLNILILPVTLSLFNWSRQGRPKRFLKVFGLWIISFAIAFGLYNILRLGPGFSNLSSRNQDYIFSPAKLLENPLDPLIPHSRDLWEWIISFFSIPLFIVLIYGIFLIIKRKSRVGLTILLWSLIPLLIQMMLLRTFTARYLLFSIPPLLVVCGYGFSLLFLASKAYWYKALLFISILAWPLYFNYTLLNFIERTPLPVNERIGYLEEWTAGYGLKEIAGFLISKAQNSLVVVGTEGGFGTLPNGLEIYIDKYGHSSPANRQVIVLGDKATVSAQLRDSARDNPTYYVANGTRYHDETNLELIKEYIKIKGANNLTKAVFLYQVFPERTASSSARSK